MHLNRVVKLAAVLKRSSLILACVFLTMSLSLSGCSKKEANEQSKKTRPPVTDLNIKTPDDTGVSAEKAEPKNAEKAEPKKEEIESLPLESEDQEEELPVLGSGG